jgi:phosphoesterase RecJ-like protein
MTSPIDWPRFIEIVRAGRRFLLTSHIRPDCDALGSELAMCGILESLGKQVTILNGQPTPPNLHFIDPGQRLKAVGVDIQPNEVPDFDTLIVLDTSAWAQLGPMAEVVRASKAKKIIVDHHVSEDDLDAEPFKNVKAEATGRLVLEAADQLGVKLTPAIATPIYAAIATDTGWFRFGSTSSYTYECAARLVAAGASPATIYRDLYEQETLARLQLRGRIIARAQSELDGRLIHTAALRDDFEQTGALPSDTEDVINLTLAVSGTQVAVIFVEQATGGFKISFRSRTPQIDCSRIAEMFDGGGHKAAAGAFVKDPWPAAQTKVLDVLRAAMR